MGSKGSVGCTLRHFALLLEFANWNSRRLQELNRAILISDGVRSSDWKSNLKTSRAHHPAHPLRADAERHVRRRFRRRNGRRFHQRSESDPTAPPSWTIARPRPADELPFQPAAFLFDVEGTLVDNMLV